MNEFQRNVAMAQWAEQQYRAWAAAQGRQPPSADPAAIAGRTETERRREQRRQSVVALLPDIVDPIERLLVAMSTLAVGKAVPSYGGMTVDRLFGPWRDQLQALDCGLPIDYDSAVVAGWFVRRAAAAGLPSVTFEPIVERKKLFRRSGNVRQSAVRAWAFERAIERTYRGERVSASPLFILEDGRMFAHRPLGASGIEGPSLVVSKLPPAVLVRMADALGLVTDL